MSGYLEIQIDVLVSVVVHFTLGFQFLTLWGIACPYISELINVSR